MGHRNCLSSAPPPLITCRPFKTALLMNTSVCGTRYYPCVRIITHVIGMMYVCAITFMGGATSDSPTSRCVTRRTVFLCFFRTLEAVILMTHASSGANTLSVAICSPQPSHYYIPPAFLYISIRFSASSFERPPRTWLNTSKSCCSSSASLRVL